MKTVLLVDDDEVFLDAVSAVLETKYQIRTAANGTEAKKTITAEKPDVVVLDVMMDHLSEGFEVARHIKEQPETREIPVVMLTGVDQVFDYRMEVRDSYVPYDRFLEKPVEPEELLQVIDEVTTSGA